MKDLLCLLGLAVVSIISLYAACYGLYITFLAFAIMGVGYSLLAIALAIGITVLLNAYEKKQATKHNNNKSGLV